MTSLENYIHIIQIVSPSLATAAALGVGGGIVGLFVLLRREALMALAMPHVVAIGAALGLRLGWPTLPPALIAVALAVILLAWSKRSREQAWLLPSLYVGGLSLSFLIIANSGQHVADLQNLFIGGDVTMSPDEALLAGPVLVLTGLATSLLWRRWLLIAQAPAVAQAAGVSTARWETAFLCILAMVLLVGTSSLGAVMVVALLFLPAATVLPWARRIPTAILAVIIVAMIYLAGGLILSIEWLLPLSQSVGGLGFCCLIISHMTARIIRR